MKKVEEYILTREEFNRILFGIRIVMNDVEIIANSLEDDYISMESKAEVLHNAVKKLKPIHDMMNNIE